MSKDSYWKHFYEIFEALPRQGPGDRRSTERALRVLPLLTCDHRILDVGCGSGTQTVDLARATSAQIVAVDNHAPFIAQFRKRIADLKLEARVSGQVQDMNDLHFPDGSFDIIWSEGAIFIVGFSKGLAAWRRLLKPNGHLVVSEFCWFVADPAAELQELHTEGCPDVGDMDAKKKAIAANGYRLLENFVLPDLAWWENFYVPLGECLERFRRFHAGDAEAIAVASKLQREIDLYEQYRGVFGYVFFVMQRS
jgi:ubiquinone/menaquinone biosynthesis C-methylase UbiE